MRFVLPPIRRSRNPLVRALSIVAGLALLGVLLVFGVVVLGVLFAGGIAFLAVRQWKMARGGATVKQAPQASHAKTDPRVLEGEFVVLRQNDAVHHH